LSFCAFFRDSGFSILVKRFKCMFCQFC
jgi:hypothetical protein